MWILWVSFLALVLGLLALDLNLHKAEQKIGVRSALLWTGFYVVLGLAFSGAVHQIYEHDFLGAEFRHEATGAQAALDYLTGYLLEKSLSLDNIFVIALIFSYFRVPGEYQHRVLYWGILGALVMRGVMIALGAALLREFSWMTYVFGGFLIVTAVRMALTKEEVDPEHTLLVRTVRRFWKMTQGFHGSKFFVRENGRRVMTPLFLVLLAVESTDVAFAVDSIPAIFAVTLDPFLVFTSNVFAILGLRSLYFALANLLDRFRYLKPSLVLVLAYVGVKMILAHHHPIPNTLSLGFIVVVLATGALASVVATRRERRHAGELGERPAPGEELP